MTENPRVFGADYSVYVRIVRLCLIEKGVEYELLALSHELNLAPRNLEVLVRAQAAVAARHVRSASSRRTRSVRREVRWRWTLNVLWTAA
jgi:hypothetical protein